MSKITRGVPQEFTRRQKIVRNTSLFMMTRMRLMVSSSQLIMLNRMETRFLLFLKTLAEVLRPGTFSSCLFLNLLEKKFIYRVSSLLGLKLVTLYYKTPEKLDLRKGYIVHVYRYMWLLTLNPIFSAPNGQNGKI